MSLGSGCDAVGRAVTSDARDLRFESCHRQFYLLSTVLKTVSKYISMKRGWERPNLCFWVSKVLGHKVIQRLTYLVYIKLYLHCLCT